MDDYLAKPVRGHLVAAMMRRWVATGPIVHEDTDMPDDQDESRACVFDPGPLRDLEQMEAGMAQQVLQVFREDLCSALAAITALDGGDDTRSLVGPAHKLKGGSGSIGAMEIQSLASEIEEAARVGRSDECHRLIAKLQEAGRHFLAQITFDRIASILKQSNPVE